MTSLLLLRNLQVQGQSHTLLSTHTCGSGPIFTAACPWLAQVKALLFSRDILHHLGESAWVLLVALTPTDVFLNTPSLIACGSWWPAWGSSCL